MKLKRVLVTGSHGYMGSAFVELLKARGIPHVCYDRVHQEIPEDVDVVVHFGGLTHLSENAGAPPTEEDYTKANVKGTEALLKALEGHVSLKRLINIGTAAECGSHKDRVTERTKERPEDAYGKSKLAQTRLVEDFAKRSGIPVVNLRIFNVAGRRKSRHPRSPNIFEYLLQQFSAGSESSVRVHNAKDVRDYVYIDDAMEAVYAALTAPLKGYHLINVCSGTGTSLNELISSFSAYFNKRVRLVSTSKSPTVSIGSGEKAARLLGWHPKHSLQESIRKIIGSRKKVIVIGAGVAGHDVVGEIRREGRDDIAVVGFLDDNKKKHGREVNGVPVLGAIDGLPRIVREQGIDQVLVSTPSVGKDVIARVADELPSGFPIKVLPSISSVILGKVDLSYVRDVDISDLIGRPLIKSDQQYIAKRTAGKTFLVTGGAGSIGSEIVRQLYDSKARRIVVVDSWEEGIFNLSEELAAQNGAKRPELVMHLGNIRDKRRMQEIVAHQKPDVIFHAAAYKHIHLTEADPEEAHKTNYLGTKNMLDLAVAHRIKEFVFISTDKAVNPTSVLGKTKRAAELLVQSYARKHPAYRYCAVRFGNVLNSSGSAIPKFLRQIRDREPVTITHKDMVRYFMSIPEAVSLVLQSWIISKNGQILILDMGEPVKILDLIIRLIKMHGLEPYTEIPIHEIGIRPGEKLFEELAYDKTRIKHSRLPRIFIAEEMV